MGDKHDIEAAALADDSMDVCRIALVLKKRDEVIKTLRVALDEIRIGILNNRDSRQEILRTAQDGLAAAQRIEAQSE